MPTRPVLERALAAGAMAVAAAALAAGCEHATLADEGPLRPATLTFSIQPEYAVAGGPIGPGVAVTVLNTHGDTSFSSAATIRLSIELGTGTAAAHLAGSTQEAAVNGTATFTGVSIDSAGVGYRLLALSDGLGGAFSDSFDVVSAVGVSAGGSPARDRRALLQHPPS
jgi:hypothetical protein